MSGDIKLIKKTTDSSIVLTDSIHLTDFDIETLNDRLVSLMLEQYADKEFTHEELLSIKNDIDNINEVSESLILELQRIIKIALAEEASVIYYSD